MGCLSKCRWCGESHEEMFNHKIKRNILKYIKWSLFWHYLPWKWWEKKGFVFFLQKVLFFFWFGVNYEHSFFVRSTQPVLKFWHSCYRCSDTLIDVLLETCTRLLPILFFLIPLFCQFHFILWFFLLFLSCWMLLDDCVLLFSFRYNTFLPSFCFLFVFPSFVSWCQVSEMHFNTV